jgi:hypothetical protein
MTTTRFAPSPTGHIHIGNLRTALMNFLIARQSGGTFILRIDDTDPERSREEYVEGIKEDLTWLGLHWDRVERQSERLDRYTAAADHLREIGRFYEAFETPVELDLKRKKQLNMGRPPVYDRAALSLSEAERDKLRAERGQGVWRFKLDHARIDWHDGILGDISIDAASVSDPVLIKADGQVLYTLASVVDDTEMGVTHVVRGSDHVTNTATQIQIIEALGGRPPSFAHHSLLTGPQGESLSKRLGTLSLREMRARGVEPMALLSLMARLGSSDPVELQTDMGKLIDGFDVRLRPDQVRRERSLPADRALPSEPAAGRGARGYRRARCAGQSGRSLLAHGARQHHHARRPRRVVGPLPRGRRAVDRRRGCGVRRRGDAPVAAPAVRRNHLERVDSQGEGRNGSQGQGIVHAAQKGTDRAAHWPGNGGADAPDAGGSRARLTGTRAPLRPRV